MKYGKLEDIRGVDFALPEDHPQTQRVLSLPAVKEPNIYVAGTMWNIPKWKGKIYPDKTPAKDMIHRYCEQFGSIELNATHYRIHPPETTRKWADAAIEDFKFCPKFPQLITHYRRFNNSEGITDEFIQAVLALEDHLGPCFIQLPPNYTPNHAEKLRNYLKRWPRELRMAIEFRHPGWFTGDPEAEATWECMEELGIGAVISDTAGRRDAVHMRMTAPFLLLRFGGNDLDPTDDQRLSDWVDRLGSWVENGMQEVHLLMHQPDSINSPESCIFFAENCQEKFGWNVKRPHLIKGAELF